MIASFLFLATTSCAAITRHASQDIQWTTCDLSSTDELNRTLPILCGQLAVPLDYSDTCAGTINLPLLKIASSQAKDSVLVNFGGPGDNGTESFISLGARLKAIIGPDHDLITWQPRGTAGDLLFSCYANATSRIIANTLNPFMYGNASDVADGHLWSNGKILSDACLEIQQENGTMIGTAYTARDAMQIVDALGEHSIRFWGLSYGTVLGATIAALFPDRVDKLILDGVINARSYYHGLVLTSRESSDDVLMGFAQGCVQTPERCPIARNTVGEVYNHVLDLIDKIKASPAVLPAPLSAGGDVKVDYTLIKSIVYTHLYAPTNWPYLASLIEAVATGNATAISEYSAGVTSGPDAESFQGIECGDTFARADTLDDAVSFLQPFRNNWFSDVDDPIGLACARWPYAAKERYDGDFNVETKPLLIISNTWDPATPLSSAKNASSQFKSVLLEQRGYGHTSTAQASLCTARRIREYFDRGALPHIGTICGVDDTLFSADQGSSSWADVLTQLQQGKSGMVVESRQPDR